MPQHRLAVSMGVTSRTGILLLISDPIHDPHPIACDGHDTSSAPCLCVCLPSRLSAEMSSYSAVHVCPCWRMPCSKCFAVFVIFVPFNYIFASLVFCNVVEALHGCGPWHFHRMFGDRNPSGYRGQLSKVCSATWKSCSITMCVTVGAGLGCCNSPWNLAFSFWACRSWGCIHCTPPRFSNPSAHSMLQP